MIINSTDIAVLQKELQFPIIQSADSDAWAIYGHIAGEVMDSVFHPDYFMTEDHPNMLIDTEKTEYCITCFNPYEAPQWELQVMLEPLKLTEEMKQELLDEAFASNTTDIVYGMFLETEDAAHYGDNKIYYSLTLTPEEQKTVFDLAGIGQREQDYILRLQNL